MEIKTTNRCEIIRVSYNRKIVSPKNISRLLKEVQFYFPLVKKLVNWVCNLLYILKTRQSTAQITMKLLLLYRVTISRHPETSVYRSTVFEKRES